MGDTVKVAVGDVVVSAVVTLTDYGYRIRVKAADRYTLGSEGEAYRVQIGRDVGNYRWVSTLPYGDEVLIALRRVELDRPRKERKPGGKRVEYGSY